jgi:DNA-binding NtrC family response regulator
MALVMSERRKSGNRIVSIGANANRLALRHAILELAGYEVWSTTNLSLALNFIRHDRCGVLLIHYSLPKEWRKILINAFRTSCPSGRVIGIADRTSTCQRGDVDEVVLEQDGTAALLLALSQRRDAVA